MDLRSAEGKGGWHPLTSMISLPVQQEASFDLFPMRFEERRPNARSGRPIGSLLQHELAHLDSARATRFGWMLAHTGGRLMNAWRQGRRPATPASFERKLGLLLPLLEGLAMYVQLDFEATETEPLLPNLATQRVSILGLGRPRWLSTFRLDVWGETEETDDNGDEPGLLRKLFLSRLDGIGLAYLVGYLWIKAAAARIAKAQPGLARPALIYPILTKLILDHPILNPGRPDDDAPSDEAFLRDLLAPLRDGSLEHLHKVHPGVLPDDLPFDLVDLHSLLADGGVRLRNQSDVETSFLAMEDDDRSCVVELRAAAQYFLDRGWQFGVAGVQTHSEPRITLDVRVAGQAAHQVDLALPEALLGMQAAAGVGDAERLKIAASFQFHAIAFFKALAAQNVEVEAAQYNRVDRTGDCGFVFWPTKPVILSLNGRRTPIEKLWLPYSLFGYDRELLEAAGLAFRLPPSGRRSFVDAISLPPVRYAALETATAFLARDLMSDPQGLGRLSGGLPAISAEHARELDEWAAVPLVWEGEWKLAEAVTRSIGRTIDLPASFCRGLQAAELFPILRMP